MAEREKRTFRVSKNWDPALNKMQILKRKGYVDAEGKSVSMASVVNAAIEAVAAATEEEIIAKLGLTRAER